MSDNFKKAGNFISNAVSNVMNADQNRRVVEIYRLKEALNTPLAINPNKIANCSINDFVLIIGDEVWIQDNNDEKKGQFSQSIYTVEFVRMNPFLFTKA